MPLSSADIDRVGELMRDTAERELLPRFGRLTREQIREKKPGDLVTVADEAAERRIALGLQTILPGVPVVGEEAVAADPSLILEIARAPLAWVVDPLDGTHNFAHGRSSFAIIVALVRQGATVAGWIHDPVAGRSAWARRGEGAWLDGERIALPRGLTPKQMRGFMGFAFRRHVLEKGRPEALSQIGPITSYHCAGREYLDVLSGQRHYLLYRMVKPWDHAAGELMYREAGGHAARFDGSPYSPTVTEGGILAAPDLTAWRELHAILLGTPLPLLDHPQARPGSPSTGSR